MDDDIQRTHVDEIVGNIDEQRTPVIYEMRSNANDGLLANGKIGEVDVDLLIDTGATISVLHNRIYERLGENKPELDTNCGELRLADGQIIKPAGAGTFNLTMGGQTKPCRMMVADIIDIAGVLGYDFLQKNKAILDIGAGRLSINGMNVKCQLESQRTVTNRISRLQLNDKTKVLGDLPIKQDTFKETGGENQVKQKTKRIRRKKLTTIQSTNKDKEINIADCKINPVLNTDIRLKSEIQNTAEINGLQLKMVSTRFGTQCNQMKHISPRVLQSKRKKSVNKYLHTILKKRMKATKRRKKRKLFKGEGNELVRLKMRIPEISKWRHETFHYEEDEEDASDDGTDDDEYGVGEENHNL